MSGAIDISSEKQLQELLSENENVLVYFWAPWSGPCRMVTPNVDEVSSESNGIVVAKVNTDENDSSAWAMRMGVRSLPTVMKFAEGKLFDTIVGANTKEKLVDVFKTKKESNMSEKKINHFNVKRTQEAQGIVMSRGEYNKYRGWELPTDENGSDEGVMLINGHHISWVPKDVFDNECVMNPQRLDGLDTTESVACKTTEELLQREGLNAPRLNPDKVMESIEKEEFFRLTGTLTVCVLTLKNGFTVTGESACASPENYNVAAGKKVSRENAIEKIWPLMGFLLKDELNDNACSKIINGGV